MVVVAAVAVAVVVVANGTKVSSSALCQLSPCCYCSDSDAASQGIAGGDGG